MNRTLAPWTDEQVKNLNDYQEAGAFHSFTCSACRDNPKNHQYDPKFECSILVGDFPLTATNTGWICNSCNYTQNWAHDFMLGFDITKCNLFGMPLVALQKDKT